jgi:hypothetical protein
MNDDDMTINNVDLAWSLSVCFGNDYPMFGVRQNHFRHSGGYYPDDDWVFTREYEARDDLRLLDFIPSLIRSTYDPAS